MDAAQVQKLLELTPDEQFILTAWQYRMMQRDVAAAKGKHLSAKRKVRNTFRTAAVETVVRGIDANRSPAVADAVTALAGAGDGPDMEALEDAAPDLSPLVARRSRALLLLIELYGFEPWTEGKWDKTVRAECLSEAHRALDQLYPEDLAAVETAYKEATRKLSRSGSWTKLVLMAAVPAIGFAAAGAVALGGGTGFTAAQVAADAIKLHVVTQLVVRDVDGNEEAAKAVIVSLRERVANLGQTIASLAERIEALRNQLEIKEAEVQSEREQRLEAEDRAARLRGVADRLKQRATGSVDEELKELLDELNVLVEEKEATETLAKGVSVLADDLDEVAA